MKSDLARSADLGMMAIIHDAFRRDLRRLSNLVASEEEEDAGRARIAAHTLWKFLLVQLEHHHTSEDERLWPLVKEKSPAASHLRVLDDMEQEHTELERVIVDLSCAFQSSTSKQLSDVVQRFKAMLEDHLDHEERDAVPLVESLLTQGELAVFERHQKKRMRLRGAAVFFPWLLDALDEPRRTVVLRELPAPMRYLAQTRWRRRYEAESRLWRSAP